MSKTIIINNKKKKKTHRIPGWSSCSSAGVCREWGPCGGVWSWWAARLPGPACTRWTSRAGCDWSWRGTGGTHSSCRNTEIGRRNKIDSEILIYPNCCWETGPTFDLFINIPCECLIFWHFEIREYWKLERAKNFHLLRLFSRYFQTYWKLPTSCSKLLSSSRYMWTANGMYSIITNMSATAMPVSRRLMGLLRMSLCVRTRMLTRLKRMPRMQTVTAR